MNRDAFEIVGGNKLYGEIRNQTSKNATLPILSASLLCDGVVKINEIPQITDVDNMLKLLKKIGVQVIKEEDSVILNPVKAKNISLDCKLSKTMRSSVFLLGSMLNRFNKAEITMPGGCKIGGRPIDIHIKALKKLGATIEYAEKSIIFECQQRCSKQHKTTYIKLRIPSVGATENIIQFACKRKGKTIIKNPAKEPEVVDLCNFLNQMGAKILGAGTNKITIYGVDKLYSTEYKPIGDRIVAGTIVSAVAIAGGDVKITNAQPYQNLKLIEKIRSMGCQVNIKNDIIHIISENELVSAKQISTSYYPEFPTDLQSAMLAVSCCARGETHIQENIFENRFLTVEELKKFGAKVKVVNKHNVYVCGNSKLVGAIVSAQDLRGGASLILMGLGAKGKSIVKNAHHIDRGYENIEVMLNKLGANIRRI